MHIVEKKEKKNEEKTKDSNEYDKRGKKQTEAHKYLICIFYRQYDVSRSIPSSLAINPR